MNHAAFIARSLALRTAAHLLHLSSTSYAQHMALDEFYTGLVPLVDSYAEVAMGLNARITTFPPVSPPSGDAATLMDQYLVLIKAELAAETSESLKNLLAGIEELTARTLYKLENLK
jgi:hypothetical protein